MYEIYAIHEGDKPRPTLLGTKDGPIVFRERDDAHKAVDFDDPKAPFRRKSVVALLVSKTDWSRLGGYLIQVKPRLPKAEGSESFNGFMSDITGDKFSLHFEPYSVQTQRDADDGDVQKAPPKGSSSSVPDYNDPEEPVDSEQELLAEWKHACDARGIKYDGRATVTSLQNKVEQYDTEMQATEA